MENVKRNVYGFLSIACLCSAWVFAKHSEGDGPADPQGDRTIQVREVPSSNL